MGSPNKQKLFAQMSGAEIRNWKLSFSLSFLLSFSLWNVRQTARAASLLDTIKWTADIIAAMSQPPLRRREKKKPQQHTNQRLCARIPTSHPNKSWEPPVALEASHLHRPTRVTGCDRTSKTPPASPRPPRSPPPHPRAWHLSHSVALYHAAGRDFKRKLGVRGLVAAAGVERPRGRRRRRSGSFFSWTFVLFFFSI